MTTEADPNPNAPPQPKYLTAEEVEAMMDKQTQAFGAMITRVVETLTPKEPAGGGNPDPNAGRVSFYDKPEEAAARLFDAKVAPLKDAYVKNETGRQLAEVAKLPLAGDYMKEITDIVNGAPEQIKMQPGYAQEVYNLVMGRHLNEVRQKLTELDARKPEFTETVSSGAPPAKKSDELSAEEKEAARRMNVPADEYRKWRDKPEEMRAAAMAGSQKKGA